MNKRTVLHIVMLAVTAAIGGIVDHLTQSHAVWAPIAVALLTDLKPLLGSIGAPPSPPAVVILAIAAVMGGSYGCWLTKPPPSTPTVPDGGFVDASPGTTFVDCSDAAIHAAGVKLIPDILTDLAMGPIASVAALETLLVTLTAQVGAPLALAELSCGVQWAINEAQANFQTTADSLSAVEVASGRAWFAKHPVTFASSP